MTPPGEVELGARPLGIADVVAVARGGAGVRLAAEVAPRLARARAVVERHAAGDAPVYGLNTGLGAAVDTRLTPDEVADFQARAVEARAVGVGAHLATDEVRALLLARLAGLARGASGISPALPEAVAAMIEVGLHPRVRRVGSLGEADLAPLAEAFLPLVGGGEAELRGEVLPGAKALARAGIARPTLGPKDGIALVNANALSAGLGALAVHDLGLALEALTASAALAMEAFRANLSPLDPRLVALRPAPGQAEGSSRLLALLAGSDLLEAGRARRVQDPLSFRCAAPVHGAALAALAAARAAVEVELNGAGDSPAVLLEGEATAEGLMLSSVNFDTTALALALEGAGLAAAHAAALAVFRIAKLMSAPVSGLPRFLNRHGGRRNGFATAQKTASALEAHIRRLALPVGPMAAPVADGIEDYSPMTPLVVAKTAAMAGHLARHAAVELAVAAEAVDLREPAPRLGRGTAAVHAFVRARVAPLADDRPLGRDFEALAAGIEAGELASALS